MAVRSFTAEVDWQTDVAMSDAALGEMLDRLADHSPAIVRSPDPAPAGAEAWTTSITLEASTLRQATKDALQLVEDATGVKAVGVQVLPSDLHDWRAEEPSIPELVGYAEVADLAGVSRQRARQLADLPGFPPAVVETAAGPLRVRAQVEGWLARWERKSGRPRKDKKS